MSKETLSRLRLLVPGLMVVVALALLILPWVLVWNADVRQDLVSFLRDYNPLVSVAVPAVLFVLIAYVLGALYRIFGFRARVMAESKGRVDSNIQEQLLAPFAEHEPVAGAADRLREGGRLLNVFYSFIDNDESLKERAKDVYLNGLLWSSVIDAMVIAPWLAGAAGVAFLVSWRPYYALVALFAIAVYASARWVMLPRVVRRHIDLSNRQIDFVLQLKGTELRSRLEGVAKAAREG